MGQSVSFWNSFVDLLKEEGLLREHLGDRCSIENTTCGTALILRLVNNKPHLNDFEDLDALSTHPVIVFERNIKTMLALALEKQGVQLEAVDIFIANRQFEVCFC